MYSFYNKEIILRCLLGKNIDNYTIELADSQKMSFLKIAFNAVCKRCINY